MASSETTDTDRSLREVLGDLPECMLLSSSDCHERKQVNDSMSDAYDLDESIPPQSRTSDHHPPRLKVSLGENALLE